jgi:hypothetical protein
MFPAAEKADRSWEYISRSQTHECGNWDFGQAIPFLEIFVSNFRYWFFAMWNLKKTLFSLYLSAAVFGGVVAVGLAPNPRSFH